MWHQEDDTIDKQIESDEEVYEKYIEDFEGFDIIGSGADEEAKDYLDQGRNCPYCGGILKYMGTTKNGTDRVYCGDCRRSFYPDDINWQNPVIDELYKTIPSKLMLHYEEYGRNRKK